MASSKLTADSCYTQVPSSNVGGDMNSSKLSSLPSSILAERKQAAQRSDLNTVVLLLREALVQRPASHPRRLESLNALAAALVTRFGQMGQSEDLDEAILLRLEASELETIESQLDPRDFVSSGDQESVTIAVLANNTLTQFRQSVQVSSLDAAVSLLRKALLSRPRIDDKRAASLGSLAAALVTRFDRTSQLKDLDEAILLYHEALGLSPDDRSGLLDNLCAALLTRFDKTAQSQDFRDAVMLRSESLGLDLTESESQFDDEIPAFEYNNDGRLGGQKRSAAGSM